METLRIAGRRINGFSVIGIVWIYMMTRPLLQKGRTNLTFFGIFLDACMRSRYCHLTPLSKG